MSGKEIKVTFGSGLKVDAEFKGFTIRTDQPLEGGGQGSAPSPFDLFLGSLATCAGFYVLAFCNERKIAAENIEISMTTEKSPGSKMISKITIRIDLPRDFPEKYRQAVVRAADNCAVKAHMLRPPAFEVIAADRS